MEAVKQLAEEWLQLDKNPKTRARISSLVASKDTSTLSSLLSERISFGTAGLRAEMDAGFSRMNELTIIQATQGLYAYLQKTGNLDKGIVIGRDHRHNSEAFARLTAAVFLSKNVKVYYYAKLVHTPLVPFAVKKLGAACGIMITASHNPKNDNGYKVYWDNACQIIPPHDKGIAEAILENLVPWTWDYNLVDTNKLASFPDKSMIADYYNELSCYCTNKATNLNSKTPIFCYTAMHGVGYEYAKLAFQKFGIKNVVTFDKQIHPDPDFPTVTFPNPEEGGALALSIQTADSINASIILANDPDADRLAVAEKQSNGDWHIFTGNELGTIIGSFCFDAFQRNPSNDIKKVAILASTVSSKFFERMAKVEGFRFEDTLTGFKWLGNRAIELTSEGYTVIFAFEEAIGFMVGDIVRDKDGISAMSVLCENAISIYNQGGNLLGYLETLYQKYGYFVTENSYFVCHDKKVIAKIFRKIRFGDADADNKAKLSYPTKIGRHHITSIRDLTVGYDNSQPDNKPLLPVSASSEMITFRLDNSAVITLRTSGTEPKIKYYSELCGKTKESTKLELSSLIQQFIKLLEPEKNNLVLKK